MLLHDQKTKRKKNVTQTQAKISQRQKEDWPPCILNSYENMVGRADRGNIRERTMVCLKCAGVLPKWLWPLFVQLAARRHLGSGHTVQARRLTSRSLGCPKAQFGKLWLCIFPAA